MEIKKTPSAGAYGKRMTGIEPASKAWEAFILPMNYIRIDATFPLYQKIQNCKGFFSNIFRGSKKKAGKKGKNGKKIFFFSLDSTIFYELLLRPRAY